MANYRQIPGSKGVFDFRLDLTPVLYQLGAMQAMNRSLNDKTYIDALMDEAFEKADEVFDVEADALALSGGISHMYEWGTLGVNTGRSNMRIRPQNPKAKLWTNVAIGNGLSRQIVWVYRPSVATVPKPTKSETGMDLDVINAMRPHYFTWKAQVMEEGHQVSISPKESKFLLIPATKQNIEAYSGWRPHDLKRGYFLTKATITARPGATKMGTFTTFWDGFWLGRGYEIMDASVEIMIRDDYFPEIYEERPPGKMISAKAWKVRTVVEESAKATQKRVTAQRKLKARAAQRKRAARKAKK